MLMLGLSWQVIGDVLAWLAFAAAGLAGLGYLFRGARRLVRAAARMVKAAEVMSDLVHRELTPDQGSGSMKADLHRTTGALEALQAQVQQLYLVLETLAEANQLIWPAIEAVANARPPVNEGSNT